VKIVAVPSGPFIVNSLLIWDEESREAMLVDPADKKGVEELQDIADKEELKVKYVVNTHEHPDHTGANAWAKLAFKEAKLLMHENAARDLNFWTESEIGMMAGAEFSPPPDEVLRDGDELKLGSITFKVLHTPGHSPGSIVLFSERDGVAIVGDLIFKGSIGRYDLPKSSFQELKGSLARILKELPPETLLIPGHGPQTTIKEELETNPFIRELFL